MVDGNLYYMYITVCDDGWFGPACSKQCNCLDEDDICNKTDGFCNSGCQAGFEGRSCESKYSYIYIFYFI